MTQHAVYMLRQILDDPRYEGFAFENDVSQRDNDSLEEDFMPDDMSTSGRNWSAPKMSATWTPQVVVGKVQKFNDFPCINLSIPAFSERATEVLSEFLNKNGELLPLVSSIGKYYAYNTTTVADVLDLPQSLITWYSSAVGKFAITIDRYVCDPQKLDGLSIFRIVEKPASVYVTQPFVDRIIESGLRGFACKKLWPLP